MISFNVKYAAETPSGGVLTCKLRCWPFMNSQPLDKLSVELITVGPIMHMSMTVRTQCDHGSRMVRPAIAKTKYVVDFKIRSLLGAERGR